MDDCGLDGVKERRKFDLDFSVKLLDATSDFAPSHGRSGNCCKLLCMAPAELDRCKKVSRGVEGGTRLLMGDFMVVGRRRRDDDDGVVLVTLFFHDPPCGSLGRTGVFADSTWAARRRNFRTVPGWKEPAESDNDGCRTCFRPLNNSAAVGSDSSS